MIINNLSFENFRNLQDKKISFNKNMNVIYGDNAEGKTNLLEALWLFCGGHSFRNNKESELIKFNEDFYKLRAEFYSNNREQNAEIRYIENKNKKQVFINDIEKKSSSYLTEVFSSVVFFPDHLDLIKDTKSKRRKFLDTAICQQNVKYATKLSLYNKTLKQRNTLLKDIYIHKELKDTVSIWDEYLSIYGAKIIKERYEYIKKLKEIAKKYHFGISNNKEELNLTYLSDVEINETYDIKKIKEELYIKLNESLNDDIRYGHTNIGPHRDDMLVEINNISAKTFASQGQQRSAVLSLKLSEAELLYIKNDERPIILLDDVLSELDNKRQDYLLNEIKDYQVFVTCCEKSNKEQLKNGKIFFVNEGNIK